MHDLLRDERDSLARMLHEEREDHDRQRDEWIKAKDEANAAKACEEARAADHEALIQDYAKLKARMDGIRIVLDREPTNDGHEMRARVEAALDIAKLALRGEEG